MKYVVFLGDGMADTPVKELDGKTPLMVAEKANIDSLAPLSEVGLVRTVPEGMKPGSDTANLSVMGYDPRTCYSGRSPLEALSMGLTLSDTDIAVRCNLVTLSSEEERYADKRMIDYSAGEISSEEARELIEYVQEHLGNDRVSFHPGISYRHCLIVHDAKTGSDLTPPHDITGKGIKRHLPSGLLGELFLDLQMRSYDLLKDHPVNVKRVAEGKNPANSVWFWGEGTKPNLPDFEEKNGIKGAVISAVDLLKGIGKGAGMEVIEVPGATGNVHTDFAAKGRAAIDALGRVDYVYIHVEAPDESGHQGSLSDKITSIEKIDSDIVGPVLAYLKECGEPSYHVLICPDHPTPLAVRTHTSDPVPYLIYRSDAPQNDGPASYDEESAKSTGVFLEEGFHLIDRLLSSESTGEKGISPSLVTMPDSGEEITLNAQGEDHSENAEQSDSSDENALTEEKDEKPEAEEKKSKEKGKFARFFKKHIRFFIIAIAVVLLVGGLVAGHFIATYDIAFVDSESELREAIGKKHIKTIVLKDNVNLSSDLILPRSVDIDLNEYTLTVQGDISLSLEKNVSMGYKKRGKYVKGGKIVANSFSAIGSGHLKVYADFCVNTAEISASSVTIKGNFYGDTSYLALQSPSVTIRGNNDGVIALSNSSVLTYNGKANEINGGKEVYLSSGSASCLIGSADSATDFYVYEGVSVSQVRLLNDLSHYYYVRHLASPDKITVLQEGNEFRCYISEVVDATHFSYSLNGVEMGSVAVAHDNKATVIVLNADKLSPGKQTIAVKATAPGDPRFLDSREKKYIFEFSAKLDSPQISVNKDGDVVYLHIPAVTHATSYSCKVDGVSFTAESGDTDITDRITAGGVHIIEVSATSNNRYFSASSPAMTSYVTYLPLDAPIATYTKTADSITVSWEKVQNASVYLVRYGEYVIYTTDLTLTLPLQEAALNVQAVGSGYYLNSAEALAEEAVLQEAD